MSSKVSAVCSRSPAAAALLIELSLAQKSLTSSGGLMMSMRPFCKPRLLSTGDWRLRPVALLVLFAAAARARIVSPHLGLVAADSFDTRIIAADPRRLPAGRAKRHRRGRLGGWRAE